jgi:hypothetical protein
MLPYTISSLRPYKNPREGENEKVYELNIVVSLEEAGEGATELVSISPVATGSAVVLSVAVTTGSAVGLSVAGATGSSVALSACGNTGEQILTNKTKTAIVLTR